MTSVPDGCHTRLRSPRAPRSASVTAVCPCGTLRPLPVTTQHHTHLHSFVPSLALATLLSLSYYLPAAYCTFPPIMNDTKLFYAVYTITHYPLSYYYGLLHHMFPHLVSTLHALLSASICTYKPNRILKVRRMYSTAEEDRQSKFVNLPNRPACANGFVGIREGTPMIWTCTLTGPNHAFMRLHGSQLNFIYGPLPCASLEGLRQLDFKQLRMTAGFRRALSAQRRRRRRIVSAAQHWVNTLSLCVLLVLLPN